MKLYKFGAWKQTESDTYHVVMAENKEDATKKANVYQQRLIDKFPRLNIELYTVDDCVEHDSDVWEGEWA